VNKLSSDSQSFAIRLIELLGGREAARKLLDESHEERSRHWDQDTTGMGRILRAHLFVEHYLARYLSVRNPNMGPIDDARLTFAQKVALVDRSDPTVSYLTTGVARLNKVRNRLAHTLTTEVTPEDRDVFLSIRMFTALRDRLAEPNVPRMEPIDVLEDFARHAGLAYASASDPHRALWAQALAAN
jgi:hypothetical protein